MLAYADLPHDVRRLIRHQMLKVCVQEMTIPELGVVRLVNARMAATFYKRCMMMTMLRRYKPFFFRLNGVHGDKYYDLHKDIIEPCKLPKEHIDLRTFPRARNNFGSLAMRSIDLDRLYISYLTARQFFMARTEEQVARALLDHRIDVHKHLMEQESRLFLLRRLGTKRPIDMNNNKEDLFPRAWRWI